MNNSESSQSESGPKLVPPHLRSGQGNALTQDEKHVGKTLKKSVELTDEELAEISTRDGLLKLLSTKNIDVKKALAKLRYEQDLEKLQIELVRLQRSVQLEGRRQLDIREFARGQRALLGATLGLRHQRTLR